MFGFSRVGRQPCNSPFLPGVLDPLFDVADRLQIFIEFSLVVRADVPAQIFGFGEDRVEDAFIAALLPRP